MLRRLGKKAQSTAEYAILIALVVGAIMAMQVFVRRGLQGRVRDVVNYTGGQTGLVGGVTQFNFTGSQYEPYYLSSNAATSQDASETQALGVTGTVSRAQNATSTVNRTQTTGWTGQP